MLYWFGIFMLLSFFWPGHFYSIGPQICVLFEHEAIQATIPTQPLAEGSIEISLAGWRKKSFLEWSNVERSAAWYGFQRIVDAWKSTTPNVKDYFIYGKATPSSSFSWEIVPYPQGSWALWQQLRVLWRIAFGAPQAADCTRNLVAKKIAQALSSSTELLPLTNNSSGREQDPFCRQEVTARQTVFEGKEIRVLYNFAPIRLGGEELHFLFVPIAHKARFNEVTLSEYLECQELASRIVRFYQENGYPTAYLFDKTGKRAGQTVPHWHQHLVFTKTEKDDWKGKWDVFRRMLFGSSPLPPQELARRVSSIRSDLKNILQSG